MEGAQGFHRTGEAGYSKSLPLETPAGKSFDGKRSLSPKDDHPRAGRSNLQRLRKLHGSKRPEMQRMRAADWVYFDSLPMRP